MNRAAIYRPEARGTTRRHGPHFDHPLSGAVALVYVFLAHRFIKLARKLPRRRDS